MSSRGAGTNRSVHRALGWIGETPNVMRAETAPCLMCGADLRFTTGEFGQTLEICTGRSCPGRFPHAPRPDPSQRKKPYVKKSRARRDP